MGPKEVNLTYFMTPKINLTFDLDLDLKVKHLTWPVTTNVQAALLCDKAVTVFHTYRVCSFIMFIFSHADKSTP